MNTSELEPDEPVLEETNKRPPRTLPPLAPATERYAYATMSLGMSALFLAIGFVLPNRFGSRSV